MIRYEVTPVSLETHLFQIDATLDGVTGEQRWQLPAWVPGSYMIRDFARHVITAEAWADGESLAIVKQDKHTWQTAAPVSSAKVTVRISIHAHDTSVRAAFLDNRYGFFDGTSVFLKPEGHDDAPCEVTIHAPTASHYDSWTLATGLETDNTDGRGFGRYTASNYADLIDRPVMMGKLTTFTFDLDGHPHHIVLNGRQRANSERLTRDVEAICRTHAALYGEVPMANYTFLTNVTGSEYGGLEHRNSSSLACARAALPRANEPCDKVRPAYRQLLGLFSHEYFHSWNVKRIKPAAFTPYDLTQEVNTELLWAFEGITSYYDDLGLARSGVISPTEYLDMLAQILTRVARGNGRLKQTVTESSRDAWTRFYKQDANAPNAIVSYYAKGAWVALALDMTIREKTGGKKTLDDVMRLLWQTHGKTGKGVAEQGIQPLAEQVAGVPLDDFFQQALYSTEDIDLAAFFAPMGITLNWRAATGHKDTGGKPGIEALHLGALLADDPLGAKLRVLYEQGIAMQAGLAPGDVLIAMDHLKVTKANIDDLLANYQPGDKVRLHAFRDDELMTADVVLASSDANFAWFDIKPDGLTQQGKNWLHQL